MLTAADRDRLRALLDTWHEPDARNCCFLREELDRAEIAHDDVPAALLVTMGSEVKFIDHGASSIRRVKLAYPDEAGGSRIVSVLTPLGSALIGLGPGQSIDWYDRGAERRLTVLEVHASHERSTEALDSRSLR